MSRPLLAALGLSILLCNPAFADDRLFPATLVGQAVVPANSIIKAPADAPAFLQTSGKFTESGKRTEALGSIPGKDANRTTGIALPFAGQPLQGFSGIKAMADGTFWTLSDNGYGAKANSSDAMLMLHHIRFDWDKGNVERLETVFLSDPDRKATGPIVLEGAEKRYLTGADFDVESIQPVEDGFWLGEEFQPAVLKVNRQGELQRVIPTEVDGKPVLSPDNPALSLPANPTAKLPAFNLKRSGGFEGLALSKDGAKLYALLEGPLYTETGAVEQVDGQTVLHIIELDAASAGWTGRSWLYPLSAGGVAIGDFNMIDQTTALIIERDGGEGGMQQACADPKTPTPTCFAQPAKHKRIYKIEMTDDTLGKPVRKIGYIDLMAIADPDHKARQGGKDGLYSMPFVTIENVDIVDGTHILVGNDNNLPFSAGRALDKADDSEFVLLDVADFLKAR
ncbi:esterase-like activity of phytase family protein [Rhizobium sp. SSA_523]|uniref:esterase-like activity of phytase family protein n=1 Tax=Rhizobium sp. SSA_523 TaxID=2952477 RepID=UPI00209181CD|nr:esterase-like activity of phytase family protein [Rhizobium sp. SSA_523]MCO5730721.1 esterase-like activity of phytase family protein [Rhizobium sp. SSA_523]WKC24455.1 esterase-like activity of phytase family protein [Rhizobium sp. SSA_523]